jgi:glycosyltransferase involved in cell wall biosynthesis
MRERVPSLTFIVPGRLETRTGGYEYDRRIVAGLRARGWRIDVQELDSSFPRPTVTALAQAARALAAIPDHATVLIDGLAIGAMPAEVEREAARLRIVALVHLPLAAEIGLDREAAAALEASERRALAAAAHVIVTGRQTIEALAAYGVGLDRMTAVEPGTNRAPLSRGSTGGPLELLCVATLNPGKGHEILIRARAAIRDRSWHLTCAGSLERDPATVEHVRATVAREGLDDRVSLAGEVGPEALEACYDRADVFVLATLHETYGMAVAEALAHGLPVISTSTGAIPDLVADGAAAAGVGGPAGIVVPPCDQHALADALSRVLGDARAREELAGGARRVRDRLPTWEDASGKMAAALGRFVPVT